MEGCNGAWKKLKWDYGRHEGKKGRAKEIGPRTVCLWSRLFDSQSTLLTEALYYSRSYFSSSH